MLATRLQVALSPSGSPTVNPPPPPPPPPLIIERVNHAFGIHLRHPWDVLELQNA